MTVLVVAFQVIFLQGEGMAEEMLGQAFTTGGVVGGHGLFASAAFLASDILRFELHDVTGCGAIDMNLLGLTVATSAHAIPSLHFRVVSDDADDGANEAFITFINAYKGEGGRIIAKVIKDMPKDPTAPSSYRKIKKLLDSHGN